MTEYEFHPFANAFPMMSDQEHTQLVADIKANGLKEEISLYQGKILDGRNRYKALVELGIDVEGFVREEDNLDDYGGYLFNDDESALAFVISKNLMRRHLDESQRAMVAAKLTGLRSGQRADQVQGLPIGRAATMLNVGERSVARARRVIDKGDPELVAAVDRGEIAVSKAAKQIDEAAPISAVAGNGHDLATPPTLKDAEYAAFLDEAGKPPDALTEKAEQDARRDRIKEWQATIPNPSSQSDGGEQRAFVPAPLHFQSA
jgi:hypothetical protein